MANTLTVMLVTGMMAGRVVLADEAAETVKSLKQQIEELDQKVRVLERNGELEKEESETKAKGAPEISLDEKGFSFNSVDGNFGIKLKGLLQLDSRTFFNDGGIRGNDGFILRRARPILEGTVFHDFDFSFVPEFGGGSPQILDAYLNYRYQPELQFQVGKFKSPVGLEQLQSDSLMPFVERSLATDLMPNRDLGVELHGELFDKTVRYAAGVFNGVADSASSNNSDFDDTKEFAGRLFVHPLKKTALPALRGIGFGVGGSYGTEHGAGGVSNYRTDGQQTFFSYNNGVAADGTHWRVSPQGYYYFGPFGVMGEYAVSSQKVITTTAPTTSAKLDNTASQIVGSWVLTGEDNTYQGVVPSVAFNPAAGQWGAVQVVARYARLEVDSNAFAGSVFADPAVSAKSASAWGVGLNWWLNRNVRISTAFSRTTFDGGVNGIVTRQPENVLFTRVQLAF